MMVESGGNPLALSPKGARGLWQLMPETARRYGLTVDGWRDDRIDLEKSTEGAARYLRELHTEFDDWALALAAYNTGKRNVEIAIERAQTREFNALSLQGYLPAETRKYVPAVLAAMGSGREFLFESQQRVQPTLVYALAMH
jgi:membrane-bound lytic murein transglycosylase D